MTKHRLIWFITLIILTVLTGCQFIEGETDGEALPRLSLSDWPTPLPTPTPITPTPFPKITPILQATPEANPTVTALASATITTTSEISTTNATQESTLSGIEGVQELLLQQINAVASARFPPIGVAFTTIDQAPLRQGPGDSYGANTTLERGELLAIIGKNGEWLYGFGTSQKRGWVALEAVRVIGDLNKAPVLPTDPLGSLVAELAPSSPSSSSGEASTPSNSNTSGSATASTMTDLAPVTTGTVTTSGLNVRQGPGAVYDQLGTLAQNDKFELLAINKTQEWALISADNFKQGWISLDHVALTGDISAAPVVRSATPDAKRQIPAGEIAPILSINGAALVADTPNSGLQPTNPVAVEPASNPSSSPFNNLGPITTARLNKQAVDLRRGPGTNFGVLDTLTADDTIVSILAQDESKQWVLVQVQNFSEDRGWINLNDLRLEGPLDNAPQVLTAWVESNGVQVRRGPGIYHAQVGELGLNAFVRVHGLAEGRSWALIQPISGGGAGWVQIKFLTVNGVLADIPLAPELVIPDQTMASTQTFVPPPIPPRPVGESQLVIQLASGGDIMVINPDGNDLRRLTNGIDPVLSPTGQTVAFTRWQGETGSLWLIDSDGGNERSVLGFIKQAKGPEWSPDGSQVVLNFQQGGRLDPKGVCTDLTQSNPGQPPQNATNIRVSLDSNGEPQLCWELPRDPHWSLRVVNIADGRYQDLDGGTYAFRPTWDPSQTWRIVSDGGRGLLAVDPNNRDYRETISTNVADSSPVFSPDGRYLAVSAGPPGGGSGHDIYRLNRDGSGRVELTETPLWISVQPDSDGQQWNNVAPTWSPDGSQIAFLTDRAGPWEIWLMNSDGSNQRPMFSAEINDQLPINYDFVDERVLSWR